MFFYASKILWLIAEPGNFLLALLGLGLLLGWTRWAGRGRRLVLVAGAGLLLCGFSPLGSLMLTPLEARFAAPPEDMPAPTGILVLGGGIDEALTMERNQVALTESGVRMTAAVALALRYPQARLVFSGGSAALLSVKTTESAAARRMWSELGIAPERMIFEDKSRNTFENALFSKEMVQPKAGERWLLVTSAYHMPRSVGIFRKAGFAVTPYPVDYRTRPWPASLHPQWESRQNLALVDVATREWMGLAAYWLSGRTDALFPAPAN